MVLPPTLRSPAIMFVVALTAEFAVMLALARLPGLDGGTIGPALADGALVAAVVLAGYVATHMRTAGRWTNGLMLAGVALTFELGIHLLTHTVLPGQDSINQAIVNAIAIATVVAVVSSWLSFLDRNIAGEAALGARPKPVALAWALAAAFAALIIASGPSLHTLGKVQLNQAGHGAAALINLSGSQRMLSQRIGRLAMLDAPSRTTEMREAINAAVSQAAMLDRASEDFLLRIGATPDERTLAPGNPHLAERRAAYLDAADAVLRARTAKDRAAAQDVLQLRIDEFQPAMDAAVQHLLALEDRSRGEVTATQSALALLSPAAIFLLALGMFWPILRLISAQQARMAEEARIVAATNTPIIRTDAARKITWVNPAFTRLTGYSLEEARGKSPGALLQGPGTDPQTVAALRDALDRAVPIKTTILNYSRAGKPYWLDIDLQPLFDSAGALEGFQAVETDITDLVEARESAHALSTTARAKELLLDRICDVSSVGGWELDVATGALTATDSLHALMKAPPGKLNHDASFAPFMEPDDLAQLEQLIRHAIVTGEGWDFDHTGKTFAGDRIWVRSVGRAQRVGGRTVRLVGVVSDISADKARLDALEAARRLAEEANNAKSQFIANMSHELRTPLNAILGYLELLEDEALAGNAAALSDSGRIKSAAHHLLDLINEILDLAKIDAGQLAMAFAPTDMDKLVGACVSLIGPAAAAKDLTLTVAIDGTLGAIETDAKRLKQCLLNLLSNAVKFTAAGAVRLSARRVDERLEFTVSDTGCGMSQDQLSKLFLPFSQVDASLTRRHEGAGLGLAITRRIARLLGGDVAVTSTLGEGSVFRITVATNHAARARSQAAA